MTKSIQDALRLALDQREGARIPTSSMGRLGRMAGAALRGTRLSWGKGQEGEMDPEKLVKLITSIGRLKGIAMKMGQIMSYIDVALPREFQDALAVLQTHAQPMPFETVARIVQEELGSDGDVLLRGMERTPIAAASIGQVHQATIGGERLAVKVQYPEIAQAIASDFGPAAIGTTMASVFYPNARIDGFVKEARERFLEECDYVHEAHCQHRFQEIFADHPVLFVPSVHRRFCGEKVLATSFVEGQGFDAFLETEPSQSARDRIGKALFEFYIGALFTHCIYNCDPHPGNYLFCADGRVAMLDHGCTREFEPRFVSHLANLTRAVHLDDRDSLHRALLRLKMVRANKSYDYEMIRGFLRSFYGPMLVDDHCTVDMSAAMEMREMMKKKQQLMRFSLPGEFTFLFRIRFGLMSVLSRLGARANWYRLEKRYVDTFSEAHPILTE